MLSYIWENFHYILQLKNNDMKFYIGKYDGQMVDDIYEKDINYCNWFVETYPTKKETLFIIKTKIYKKHSLNLF